MDRFKFRVWGIRENSYYDGLCLQQDGKITSSHPQEYIVEQCTGLKDKNGKLIYENDIAEWQLDDMDKPDIGKIVMHKGGCYFIGQEYDEALGRMTNNLKVISNIHEVTK